MGWDRFVAGRVGEGPPKIEGKSIPLRFSFNAFALSGRICGGQPTQGVTLGYALLPLL